MCVVCHVRGLGPSHTSKQNVLSFFFLLIPLVKLMNQKRANYRHLILYPLQLGPPFPNNNNTRRSRDDLRPSYGNALVERCFWKDKNPYKTLRVHTRP